MRGFVSFLIVFACIAIILLLLSINPVVSHSNQAGLKKLNVLELDIKNTLLDLASSGANRAAREYIRERVIEAAVRGVPPVFDISEIRRRARIAGYEEMRKLIDLLGIGGQEFEVSIWCGYTNDAEMAAVRDRMYRDKHAVICDGCLEIKNEECAGFINIDIKGMDPEGQLGAYAEVGFWKEQTGADGGVIGISAYSERYGIASASYIPVGEKR